MVYMMLFPGFEETEMVAPLDLLRRAGIDAVTVGGTGNVVASSHGIPIVADISLGQMDLTQLEMIVLPGGKGALAPALNCPEALEALRFAWENGKFVAAICAAPTVLASLGILAGKNFTCYPGFEAQIPDGNLVPDAAVVRDGNLITGTSAGCAIPFGLALVAALRGQAAADAVREQIVIRR